MDSRVPGTTTISRAVAEHGVPTAAVLPRGRVLRQPGRRRCWTRTAPAGQASSPTSRAAGRRRPSTGRGRRRAGGADADRGRAVGQGRRVRPRLLPIFRLGLGGKLGSGRQWWSAGSRWTTTSGRSGSLVERDDISGPVNISAPEPLTNADMTAAMGRVLHRPTVFTAPGCGVQVLAFSDFAATTCWVASGSCLADCWTPGSPSPIRPSSPLCVRCSPRLTPAPRRRPASARRRATAPPSTTGSRGRVAAPRRCRPRRRCGTPASRR